MKTYVVRNELDRARLVADIRRAPLGADHQPIVCRVERLTRKRSLKQNALLWSWNTILAIHVGCTPEEMHEDLCREINGCVERADAITGEIREIPKGTHGMTTVQMRDYLERVALISADHFGVALPSPDDPAAWDAYETWRTAA